MADTVDSKSTASDGVPVQVRPQVYVKRLRTYLYTVFFMFFTLCKGCPQKNQPQEYSNLVD